MTRSRSGAGHFSAWRAACAIPSILGSVVVLGIAFGWVQDWANAVLLGWLLVAAALLLPPAERLAVRVAYGYRRLSAGQAAVVAPARRAALDRCGLAEGRIDWYVRPAARGVTGYAAGRRSVAVSAGLLEACQDGRLTEAQATAILTHDLLTAPTPGLEVNARAGGLVGCA